jgi:hypothetical protein
MKNKTEGTNITKNENMKKIVQWHVPIKELQRTELYSVAGRFRNHTETLSLDPRDRFKVVRYREISLMPRFCLRQVSMYKIFNNEMRNISKNNKV